MKATFSKGRDFSYAYKMKGIPSDYHNLSFGSQIGFRRTIIAFQEKALVFHVGAKGKSTLSAIRQWVKDNKPSGFYAKWKSDSTYYKDDSVVIYYIE